MEKSLAFARQVSRQSDRSSACCSKLTTRTNSRAFKEKQKFSEYTNTESNKCIEFSSALSYKL